MNGRLKDLTIPFSWSSLTVLILSSLVYRLISIHYFHIQDSLWPEGPKFEIRSTYARTNWDPNNAFPWGVRRHISKVFITKVGQTGPNWRFSISHVMSMGKNQPQMGKHQSWANWTKLTFFNIACNVNGEKPTPKRCFSTSPVLRIGKN